MATGYDYQPLDADKAEIRLLSIYLEPVHEDAPLVFRLDHFNFEVGVPEYVAISYVWGDATKRRSIMVNGKTVSVPKNTEIALRYLHRAVLSSSVEAMKVNTTDEFGRLQMNFWIDSVCANQYDLEEREHQVAIMWRIYSSARLVLIWLGHENARTKAGIEAIESVVDDMRRETNDYEHVEKVLLEKRNRFWFRRFLQADLQHLDWLAIDAMYSSTWFQRLWVVQETVLAKEAYCVRGTHVFPWITIGRAAQWFTYRRYRSTSTTGKSLMGLANALKIQDCRDGYYDPINFLHQTETLHTSDARDRVFGFLGLLQAFKSNTGLVEALTPVDYSAPIDVIYGAVTKHFIKHDLHLWILEKVQSSHSQNHDLHPNWPSWVLRLDDPEARKKVSNPSGLSYGLSELGSCNGFRTELCADVNNQSILTLRGCYVDRIHTCAPRAIFADSERTFKKAISKAFEFAKKVGCTSEERFCRIVLLDWKVVLRGEKISQEQWPDFLQWCLGKNKGNRSNVFRHVWDKWKSAHDTSTYDGYAELLSGTCYGRRMFATRNGFIGMGTQEVKEGDDVCILFGGEAPFVLRPTSDSTNSWRLIGDAYVDEIMDV